MGIVTQKLRLLKNFFLNNFIINIKKNFAKQFLKIYQIFVYKKIRFLNFWIFIHFAKHTKVSTK